MPSSISTPGVVIPTSTGPPLPVPAVVLALCAPLVIVICGASTITDPASPAPIDEAVIWVPMPSSTSVPGVVFPTATDPPLPVPDVVLAICAPLVIVICGASTIT